MSCWILGNGPFRVRIYLPPEAAVKRPVLVYCHGGSFSFNSIEVYEYVCRYLCLAGNLIVVGSGLPPGSGVSVPEGDWKSPMRR